MTPRCAVRTYGKVCDSPPTVRARVPLVNSNMTQWQLRCDEHSVGLETKRVRTGLAMGSQQTTNEGREKTMAGTTSPIYPVPCPEDYHDIFPNETPPRWKRSDCDYFWSSVAGLWLTLAAYNHEREVLVKSRTILGSYEDTRNLNRSGL